MKFLFDNNLSVKIVKAIRELETSHIEIIHLREKFNPSTSDTNWIKALGEEKNWIVISADCKIGSNPHELQAWRETDLTIFFLKRGWLKFQLWDMAWRLIKVWPTIRSHADKNNNNNIMGYSINLNGTKLEPIYK